MKSKFSRSIYFLYIFLFAVLILGIYLCCLSGVTFKGKLGITTPSYMLGIPVIAFSSIFFFLYSKKLFVVVIETDRIILKQLFKSNRIILQNDISLIGLSERENIGFLSSNQNLNATTIYLTNDKKIVIPDFFYRNSAEIKKSLLEFFPHLINENKIERKEINNYRNASLNNEVEKFSGNFLLCYNGLLFIGLLIFIVYMLATKLDGANPLAIVAFISFFFLIFYVLVFGLQANYFLLSNEELVIKNHLLFWQNKIYSVKDISECIINIPAKRSTTLEIITTDYKTKIYSAGSLRKHTWKGLKNKLELLGVPVKDEVFS
jgi:hypothetical protein